jgi:RNA polymerase sigma factor (sigma-70 family)
MHNAQLGRVVRYLHEVIAPHNYLDRPDSDLLRAFLMQSDQAAFSAIVKRHGPLVLGVCRRTLHQLQDAEDAFQGTFLILARQAGSIRKAESLASWLHGVAYRMSRAVRRAAARRRKHEGRAPARPAPNPPWTVAWQEVQLVVDEETQRLPALYREAFILCCLENRSCADVARNLGQNEATIRGRVGRARRQLQKRLAKRGISLAAVLSIVSLGTKTGTAGVPAALVQRTVQAALAWSQHRAAIGLVSADVAALVRGVTRAMVYTKLKIATSVILVLGAGSAGFGALRRPVPARTTATPENRIEEQAGLTAPTQTRPARPAAPELENRSAKPTDAATNPRPSSVVVYDAFDGKYLSGLRV